MLSGVVREVELDEARLCAQEPVPQPSQAVRAVLADCSTDNSWDELQDVFSSVSGFWPWLPELGWLRTSLLPRFGLTSSCCSRTTSGPTRSMRWVITRLRHRISIVWFGQARFSRGLCRLTRFAFQHARRFSAAVAVCVTGGRTSVPSSIRTRCHYPRCSAKPGITPGTWASGILKGGPCRMALSRA